MKAIKGCLVLVVLAVAALWLIGTLTGGHDPAQPTATPAVTVLSWRWGSDEFGGRYIYGEAKNNADAALSYASVTFNLYDNSGARVGTAMDSVSNLDAEGTWKFKAGVLQDSATKAELQGVSVVP